MAVVSQRSRDAALKFANEVRRQLGKRPVLRLQKGQIGHARSCPIARTIDREGRVSVGNCWAQYINPKTGARERMTCPPQVQVFIRNFDKGLAPDLEV